MGSGKGVSLDSVRNTYAAVSALGMKSGFPNDRAYAQGVADFDAVVQAVRDEAYRQGYQDGVNEAEEPS